MSFDELGKVPFTSIVILSALAQVVEFGPLECLPFPFVVLQTQ